MVTDLRTLNQLEYVNGFVYVKLSQHYTLSEIEEFLVLVGIDFLTRVVR
jgi:glutamine cyclotransferase